MDAIATPFVQGRLEGETAAAVIETECGHCGLPIRIETDGATYARVLEGPPAPLVFAPLADPRRPGAASIVDGF